MFIFDIMHKVYFSRR